MNVLVLNCGSSSIKYQLLNMDAVPVVLAKGIVEKIGLTYGSFTYKPEGKDKVVAEQPITCGRSFHGASSREFCRRPHS